MGDSGRIAMLHKKELVLNQEQTRDILDTVSILEKAKSQINNIAEKSRLNRVAKESVTSNNFGDINLHFDNFRGTKQDGEVVATALLERLKKKK